VNNATKEEMAVYLGFVWQLCEEKPCYAIPRFFRDHVKRATQLDFNFVKWEYEVETGEPGLAIDKGFVRPRQFVRVPPSDWENTHKNEAGLFWIDSFRKLISLHEETLVYAFSEVNLFSIPSKREIALVDFLNSEQLPTLADFLKPGELFVDIVVGVDYCYYDSILIKSVNNIENRLQDLVSQYTQAITDYERNISNLTTMEEALQAMAKLATGKLQHT